MLPLAEGDPSTGWVVNFCVMHNWYLAQFPEEAQAEIWGKRPYIIAPDVAFPPGRAVKDSGGYRVTARWKWGTGVMNSDWIFGKALVDTPDGPQLGHFLFPSEEAEVPDVWHLDGMASTGSNDIVVKDLWIPDHRMAFYGDVMAAKGPGASAHPDSKLFHMPLIPLLCLGAALGALGAARSNLEMLRSRLQTHVTVGSGVTQAERPASQMRLARADLLVRTAENIMRIAAREAYGLSGVAEPQQELLRLRLDIAHGVSLCHEAIGLVCESAGSSLHYLSNPMQRHKRDVDVMSTHIVFDMDVLTEDRGRSLLALPQKYALT